MDIDEFLNKIENGETIVVEKPKPEIDLIIEQLNSQDADKIAVSDKVIKELQNYQKKISQDKAANESIVMKIKQELLMIRNNIASNSLMIAKSSFHNITELFELIPEEFSEDRLDLQKDISNIESSLTSKLVEFYKKDFERKKRIILMSISQAKNHIREKKISESINEYVRCQEVYRSLPEGFLLSKIEIYEMIVELYKEVIIASQICKLQDKLIV